jgi:hypothetical protein
MRNKRWARLLAYVTGSVNQELLLQNEYLAAENRILRSKLPAMLRLSNPSARPLPRSASLGRKALREVACVAKPDTILAWYRRLVAEKFDGSRQRLYPGRPTVQPEVEALVVRMARENVGWGYDRIVGALTNLATICRIRPLATFCAVTALARLRSEAEPRRGRTSSPRTWMFCRVLTLHRGSAHLARIGYLLCSVLHSSGEPSRQRGRYYQTSGSRVDGASPAARPRRLGATFIRAAMFCTIATRSSAPRFARCSRLAA